MKSFFQFLESNAVQQATRMGLTSDGHGGWYDKKGEFVAKTEKGSLKFFNKRQRIGQDPPSTEKEKSLSGMKPAGAQQPAQEPVAKLPEAPPEVEKTKGTLTVAFGRFNPPTTGHEKLLNQVAKSSDENDYIIVPSRSQDAKKNPLDADSKVGVMRQMFPKHSEKIVNDPANRTIFDVLKKAHNDGYAGVRVVGGADRQKEFDKLVNTYNGKLYKFDKVEVVSAGDRDPDADDVTGMSASKQRKAAAEGDLKSFMKGIPSSMEKKAAEELYKNIRKAMNIKEGWNLWQIAPKFDWEGLRENYIGEKIYQIGQLVENLNTGLVGRIIRRGANHLIWVTEDNYMFKSWIKDVSETQKESYDALTDVSGVPADQRLVGTDAHRKYVETMVKGSAYGKHFLNKYRKKSKQ
jgi:phosphopantetheine adenylyltransferase|tara:strand:+ start:2281 stop:3498 length:1218 start_codon:yes stop_codon:yes gene_type:complete